MGTAPKNVTKVAYTNSAESHVVMAVVECGKELYDAACSKATVFIGFNRCRIDTMIRIMRCRDCNLFGHTKNHYRSIPEETKRYATEHPVKCLECIIML